MSSFNGTLIIAIRFNISHVFLTFWVPKKKKRSSKGQFFLAKYHHYTSTLIRAEEQRCGTRSNASSQNVRFFGI